MLEDPTSESFKPVASIKQDQLSPLCSASYHIGAIEQLFKSSKVSINILKIYFNSCNKVNHKPDQYIINYTKKVCNYKYENGIHSVSL